MKSLQLTKNFTIDDNHSPYIIAEIGVNHEGSFDQAKKLIDLAKEGGADAAKFQSYKAGSLASKNSPSYWDTSKEKTKSQYELFKRYDSFEPKDYEKLHDHCKKQEIDFLSTPFDDQAIEFLDPLVPFFKIASADLTNLPFLKKIASKNKPIILSTGASNIEEINLSLDTIQNNGCKDIGLLHCILNYPTANKNAHLGMIEGLRKSYPDRVIGYSDHTLPDEMMTSLITAVLLGAQIIEKHFTFDKSLPGNDHYHAMDKNDLINFRERVSLINTLKGEVISKSPIKSEEIARRNARRSIVSTQNIPKGSIINESNITYKRPGTGISPIYWNKVLGMKAVKDIDEDEILLWNKLSDNL